MKRFTFSLLLLLSAAGCRFWRTAPASPEPVLQPAGVITRVNRAEKYLIFESQFSFPAGQNVHAVRQGRRVATLRVHSLNKSPFYAADIVEGAPQIGDLVE